ncbi:hypothetical protein [Bacillus sp. FJAT-45350]|uniref:hypothetical protein n=1 Tax=Bacillus sp. FJAT-45350 TaxID=2011014 RepID=UPI0015CBF115|nr:hypothetical protein [Bacillus sp. FJAT-45350]
MELMIIGLFLLSILLLVLSFFKKDKTSDLENQMENFSITLMQEIYQLKKKVKILEEEILAGNEEAYFDQAEKPQTTSTLMEEVVEYYEAGHSPEEIASIMSLTENDVYSLLSKYQRKNESLDS